MNEKDLQFFKELIMKKRREMMEHMESIKSREGEDTIKDASGDHSAYSFHMADQGTDNMEREKSFFYAQRDGRLLHHLDMALDRIEAGEYGDCHVCGEPIAHARLEAVPHARMCIACKSKEEKTTRINTLATGNDA